MKYLFGCIYDGVIYLQNADDSSIDTPGKSAFYDVQDKPIEKFWIKGEENTYLVDLIDGHFEINGVPFCQHEEEYDEYKLLYYRTKTHVFEALKEVSVQTDFIIGWEATKNGETHKYIIRIN